MLLAPIEKFIRSQRLPKNARTLNASIHVAMVCALLGYDEEESAKLSEASARTFRILKKELPIDSKYRKGYKMSTFMRNVNEIRSYIESNLIFGNDDEKLFKMIEIERKKIAGESI